MGQITATGNLVATKVVRHAGQSEKISHSRYCGMHKQLQPLVPAEYSYWWLNMDGSLQPSFTLQWRHNEHDGVSDHQSRDCFTQPFIQAQIKKHQSSASLGFVRGIHRSPVNSPHKGPVTRKMFPFDDVIMYADIIELITGPFPELEAALFNYH